MRRLRPLFLTAAVLLGLPIAALVGATPAAAQAGATIPVGTFPWGMAEDPGTGTIYVANSTSNDVTVIDEATDTAVATVAGPPGGGITTNAVTIDEVHHTVFVALADAPGTIETIDGNTCNATSHSTDGCVGGEINGVEVVPTSVAVNPFTNTLYVTGNSENLDVVDVSTGQVVDVIPLGYFPQWVSVDPTDNVVLVASSACNSGSVEVDCTIEKIDGATCDAAGHDSCSAAATIQVPFLVNEITADNGTAYAMETNYAALPYQGTVSVIDEASANVLQNITVGLDALSAAVDPDTHTVYIGNARDATISVLDGAACVAHPATGCTTTLFNTPFSSSMPAVVEDPVTQSVFALSSGQDEVADLGPLTPSGPPPPPPPSTAPPTPVSSACNFSQANGVVTADCDGSDQGGNFSPGTLEIASPLGFSITSADDFANYVDPGSTASFSGPSGNGCPQSSDCYQASLTIPSPFSATDADATCPTSTSSASDGVDATDAGLDFCVAVVTGAGAFTGDAAVGQITVSGQSLPAAPSLSTDLGSYLPGATVNLSGSIAGDGSQYFSALATAATAETPPADCTASGGYGTVDQTLVKAGFLPTGGSASEATFGPTGSVTVAEDCFDASTPHLAGPDISGSLTAPSGAGNYDAFVCEAEFSDTLTPPDDNEGICGTLPSGAAGWLIAESPITVSDTSSNCTSPTTSGPPGTLVSITCPVDASPSAGTPSVAIPGLENQFPPDGADPNSTPACGPVSASTGLVTCTITIPDADPQLQEIDVSQTSSLGAQIEEGFTFQITPPLNLGDPVPGGQMPSNLPTSCSIPAALNPSDNCSIYQVYSLSVEGNAVTPFTLSETSPTAELQTETATGCNGGPVVLGGSQQTACGTMPEITFNNESGSQDGVNVSVSLAYPDFYNSDSNGNTPDNMIPITGFNLGVASAGSKFNLGPSGSAPQSGNGYGPFVDSTSTALSTAAGSATTGGFVPDPSPAPGDVTQALLCDASTSGSAGTTVCGSGVSLVVPSYVSAGDYWDLMTIMATVTG